MAILKKCIQDAGFVPELHYLNIRFAARLGLDLYEQISNQAFVPTEWFFSQALFGSPGLSEVENDWAFLRNNESAGPLVHAIKTVLNGSEELCEKIANEHVPAFIEECVSSVNWEKYMVVGFTTTFAQSLASLQLAKRIKDKFPHLQIVFGGANVDDEMGVEFIRSFAWIDYVVHGEAEVAFPQLLQTLAQGNFNEPLPGVSMRRDGVLISGNLNSRPVVNLNETPVPDYTDFVAQLESSGFRKKVPLKLFFESSRGCWWGAKHHCTFCGLNGSTMAFRKKDAARVYSEILELSNTYRCLEFLATDNILATEYMQQLLPKLAERDTDITLFYEVKANLTRSQLAQFRAAGITRIQPGIESFNSRLLKLMRKGISAIQNIQLLKWCYEYDIHPGYNLLYGFPGEVAGDYEDLPQLFQLLSHLTPPGNVTAVEFERFSPYFFEKEKFGLEIWPKSYYQFIFPSRVDMGKIAYFFDGKWEHRSDDPQQYMSPVFDVWQMWMDNFTTGRIFCYYEKGPNYIRIWDNRPRIRNAPIETRGLYLNEQLAEMYCFCDENRSFKAILEMMRTRFGSHLEERVVRGWLDSLVFQCLMFREENRYLSLAVRKSSRRLGSKVLTKKPDSSHDSTSATLLPQPFPLQASSS
jgi:ribosomal peptide maturation radical SAM protein 1